jgi:hypothetical protein
VPRAIAQRLQASLGQPFVLESRPGSYVLVASVVPRERPQGFSRRAASSSRGSVRRSRKRCARPSSRSRWPTSAFAAIGGSPEQLGTLLATDHARYGKLIREKGIKAD